MMILILSTILAVILVAWFLYRKMDTKDYEKEPNMICVFPDYPRELPYVASLGDVLKFHVRGYSDKYKMAEVSLIESDIEWQHQNYIGAFHGGHNERLKGSATVSYGLPDKEKHKGKLLYVTARYHGLSDTTWIKISEV